MRGASTQTKLSDRNSYSHTRLCTISSLTSLGAKAPGPRKGNWIRKVITASLIEIIEAEALRLSAACAVD
jgi:hypothetical protein